MHGAQAPLGHVVKGTMSLEQKPGQDLGATMLSICQIVAAKCPEVAVQVLPSRFRPDAAA